MCELRVHEGQKERARVCVGGVWVCACVRGVCACARARVEGKTITAIQPFCLMKNGRLAFRDVVMCRILMCAL